VAGKKSVKHLVNRNLREREGDDRGLILFLSERRGGR